MRIHALILTTLIGCESDTASSSDSSSDSGIDTGCEPFVDHLSIDTPLSETDLESMTTYYRADDASTLTCEQVCSFFLASRYDHFGAEEITSCTLSIDASKDTAAEQTGEVACTAELIYPCGRRPQGHIDTGLTETGPDLGAFFAHCASMEIASVRAFAELARQLTALGAPVDLIRRCQQAAAEEDSHAETMGALAQQHGGHVVAAHPPPPVSDALEAIAHHNATEGCVWETWAALVCAWQATHAQDPDLRAAHRRIAADEARHAQLAWDLDGWLQGRLDAAARARVEAARRAALAALPALAARHAAWVPEVLGMPDAARCMDMATRFRQGLLAA